MPYLRFIGKYNGAPTIAMGEYVFVEREPVKVDETTDMGRRLVGNPDFELADPLDHDGNGEKGGSLPDVPVSLTNKNKAELLAIAADEGAEADESMTNAQIKAAIEAGR